MAPPSHTSSGWEYSFEGPNHGSRIRHDFEPFLPGFTENAFRVFLPHFNTPLYSYRISCNAEFHENIITDAAVLKNALEKRKRSESKAIFYFFQQESSRGRFQVTKETCRTIMLAHRVFPAFWDCIFGFGYRTEEESRVWDGFHASLMPNIDSLSYVWKPTELCYTFRYFSKGGETPEDSWSLRQTGIYQQAQFDDDDSTWILLQPSPKITSQVLRKSFGHQSQCRDNCGTDPMQLHSLFLSLCLNEFGEYIEDLQATITQMRYKALDSTVETKKLYDFSVTFTDLQKLQRAKHKLITASHIVRGTLNTLKQLQRHCQKVNNLKPGTVRVEVCDSFERFINQYGVHERRVYTILACTDSIDGLLSKMLEARNHDIINQTNTAIKILNRISSENVCESRNLAQAAAQNQQDSQMLKALTIVATLYLPASLIASSTNYNTKSNG
ncbi:hypothetical protein BDZ45DRAFT_745737 [Acephala macrosclerotiorum]|nr:hypothetical protein BDZ45DRAFT_745737 [Acephala macrosclerotiorum]